MQQPLQGPRHPAGGKRRFNTKWRDAADKIGETGAARIRGGLERNEVLTSLNLRYNQIRAEGAAAIAEALRGNEVLTTIDLSRNDIRREGGVAIGNALAVNEVLTSLDLGRNQIGDEGAKAIGKALAINGVLTSLNLQSNCIRYEGAAAIAEALQGNGVLTSLDVGWNSLTEEAALGIVRVERQRNKLTSLGLADCRIGPTGAAEIAEYVSGSRVLKTLNLSHNQLCSVDIMGQVTYSAVGITALAEALKVNGVLKRLDIRANDLGDEGEGAIRDAVSGREGFKLEM